MVVRCIEHDHIFQIRMQNSKKKLHKTPYRQHLTFKASEKEYNSHILFSINIFL